MSWSPVIQELIDATPIAPLDEGAPDRIWAKRLRALSAEDVVPNAKDIDAARCCWSGLFLRIGCLEDSHVISQDLGTPEASFWHGIMHRREGDTSNAKYWFRRVGEHAVFPALAEAAGLSRWDAAEFVDRCATAVRNGEDEEALRELQDAEWRLLLEHCLGLARGE
ncbi:MAG: hypothetical protein RL885_06830 [Planctomycetota bacterium]